MSRSDDFVFRPRNCFSSSKTDPRNCCLGFTVLLCGELRFFGFVSHPKSGIIY